MSIERLVISLRRESPSNLLKSPKICNSPTVNRNPYPEKSCEKSSPTNFTKINNNYSSLLVWHDILPISTRSYMKYASFDITWSIVNLSQCLAVRRSMIKCLRYSVTGVVVWSRRRYWCRYSDGENWRLECLNGTVANYTLSDHFFIYWILCENICSSLMLGGFFLFSLRKIRSYQTAKWLSWVEK